MNRRFERRKAAVPQVKSPPAEDTVFRDFIRRVSDFYTFRRICPHRACARHRRCAHPRISCYRDHESDWRREIFPRMREAIGRRLAAGPDGDAAHQEAKT